MKISERLTNLITEKVKSEFSNKQLKLVAQRLVKKYSLKESDIPVIQEILEVPYWIGFEDGEVSKLEEKK
jgi:TolB-like protein